ncbi:MAG: hypothetical protein ABJC26_05945 [Gemmatimonadaceae bacterium]
MKTRIMSNVQIAPTLDTMHDVYRMSREGGRTSERFQKYVTRVENEWGLVTYNPMAGDAALDAVVQLLAFDAEAVMKDAAERVCSQCEYHDSITLAISVRSKGLWTDRIATEVDDRISDKPRRTGYGIVSLWSREENLQTDVIRESAAETVRVMWAAIHGAGDTLHRVLALEGLAYAIATQLAGTSRFSAELSPEESVAVIGALEVLGDTRIVGDIAGVLFGDDVAKEMGWTPLGIPNFAGYRWAVARAERILKNVGPTAALRATVAH